MRSFAVEGKALDRMDFSDAQRIDMEYEKEDFQFSQKFGRWKPTRELAWDALRSRYNDLDEIEAKIQRMSWWIALEGFLLLVLFGLHLF